MQVTGQSGHMSTFYTRARSLGAYATGLVQLAPWYALVALRPQATNIELRPIFHGVIVTHKLLRRMMIGFSQPSRRELNMFKEHVRAQGLREAPLDRQQRRWPLLTGWDHQYSADLMME